MVRFIQLWQVNNCFVLAWITWLARCTTTLIFTQLYLGVHNYTVEQLGVVSATGTKSICQSLLGSIKPIRHSESNSTVQVQQLQQNTSSENQATVNLPMWLCQTQWKAQCPVLGYDILWTFINAASCSVMYVCHVRRRLTYVCICHTCATGGGATSGAHQISRTA